nr:methylated-DNA--[protein]-cysteine S-methyltransferase [Litchfieldia alkalitelluris]
MYYTKVQTPLGILYISSTNGEIIDVSLSDLDFNKRNEKEARVYHPSESVLLKAEKQLGEYFKGDRKSFSLPLKLVGTSFQLDVWKELCKIPYGEIVSYQDVATNINNQKAVRAVGQANRRNPIPILVPCHRVLGKNNALTGYAGERIDLKEKLLKLEGVLS